MACLSKEINCAPTHTPYNCKIIYLHIHTISFHGIDTIPVSLQVYLSTGLPVIAIFGLADKAVVESCERVRAALSSLGLALPAKRIAVNLSPVEIIGAWIL